MIKKRRPMQVSEEMYNEMTRLKRLIMQTGKEISLRDLTEKIVKSPSFRNIEDEILKKNMTFDIKIKFDGRNQW